MNQSAARSSETVASRPLRSRAPIRLDLAGGWTDVPPFSEREGGAVVNAGINRYTYATLVAAYRRDRSGSSRPTSTDSSRSAASASSSTTGTST